MSGEHAHTRQAREHTPPEHPRARRRRRRADGPGGLRGFLRPAARMGQERAARVIIAVFALALVATVVLWIAGDRFEGFVLRFVLGVFNIPASTSLVSIVVLALIVGALVRRKRVALVIVGAFQVLGVVWSSINVALLAFDMIPTSHGIVEALGVTAVLALECVAIGVGVALVWLLWWVRPAFPARVTPGSWVKAGAVALGGAVLSLVVVMVLLRFTGPTNTDRSPWATMTAVVRRSLGVERPRDIRVLHEVGTLVPLVLEVSLSLTLVLALWVFLRSAKQLAAWNGDREVEVRRLVAHYGQADSLGYFATRRDRSYAFSDDGRAVVAYRVVGSVALASGDPVGERTSWPSAVANWLATAREFGWMPGVTSASAEGARYLAGLGFSVVPLGDEAVLYPDRFTLDSTSLTPVRQAVTRARRAGLTVQIRRHGDLSPAEMHDVVELADLWRLGGAERGFSMALERLGDPADTRCLLVMARDAKGSPVGLLSFVPWGQTGLSLDVMRRSPEAPNGVTELMVAELMDAADDLGVMQVSLNFAVMRSVFADAKSWARAPSPGPARACWAFSTGSPRSKASIATTRNTAPNGGRATSATRARSRCSRSVSRSARWRAFSRTPGIPDPPRTACSAPPSSNAPPRPSAAPSTSTRPNRAAPTSHATASATSTSWSPRDVTRTSWARTAELLCGSSRGSGGSGLLPRARRCASTPECTASGGTEALCSSTSSTAAPAPRRSWRRRRWGRGRQPARRRARPRVPGRELTGALRPRSARVCRASVSSPCWGGRSTPVTWWCSTESSGPRGTEHRRCW